MVSSELILKDWYSSSSIRTNSRSIIDIREIHCKQFFPYNELPLLIHPLLQDRDEDFKRLISIHRLYSYLDFTDILEHEVVNQALRTLIHNNEKFCISNEMKLNARKIYVDEAYHSLFSADLKSQVSKLTQVDPLDTYRPVFIRKLESLISTYSSELRETIIIFFAFVSETLISSVLSEIPNNTEVITAIRSSVSDHARDEKTHHLYFSELLPVLWSQLNTMEQEIIGSLFPQFILFFLLPDQVALIRYLTQMKISIKDSETIIQDTYSLDKVLPKIKMYSKATIYHLKKNGILGIQKVHQSFCESGLL